MTTRRTPPASLPQRVLDDYAHLWAPMTDSALAKAQIELADLSDSDREYHREVVMYALLAQNVRTERALVAMLRALRERDNEVSEADPPPPPAPPPRAERPRPTLVRSPPPSQVDVDDASDGDALPDFDTPTEEAPGDDDGDDDTAGDEDA